MTKKEIAIKVLIGVVATVAGAYTIKALKAQGLL
jgi:hypothetical protein